jgi:hypothetical protein
MTASQNHDSESLQRIQHSIMREYDRAVFDLARAIKDIVPEIEIEDIFFSCKIFQKVSEEDQIIDTFKKSVKDFVMITKLAHSDEFSDSKTKLYDTAKTELAAKKFADQQYQNAQSFFASEEYEELVLDGEMLIEGVFDFIEKIKLCPYTYSLSTFEKDLAFRLEKNHLVKLKTKGGWFSKKRFCFNDPIAVDRALHFFKHLRPEYVKEYLQTGQIPRRNTGGLSIRI